MNYSFLPGDICFIGKALSDEERKTHIGPTKFCMWNTYKTTYSKDKAKTILDKQIKGYLCNKCMKSLNAYEIIGGKQ